MPKARTPRLRLENISRSFGEVHANKNISLKVEPGRVLALLGENGAGKSTLMSILAGQIQPSSGTIYLDDRPVILSSTDKAIQAGIGMVYQHFKLVEAMSVAENVFLGQKGGFWLSSRKIQKKVQGLADQYGIRVDPAAKICELSMGEKQQAEILKLLHRKSSILLFDEPTAMLTPVEADALFRAMRLMADEGKSIVFISHKLEEVMAVADDVAIIREGRIVDRIEVTAATSISELADRMVGRQVFQEAVRQPMAPRQIVLKVEKLEGWGLRPVDLEVRKGEIVSIVGDSGNGQKPLVEMVCGLKRPAAGTVKLLGFEWSDFFRSKEHRRALSYIPEDRQGLATCQGLDLLDNFLLTTQGDFVKGGWLQKEKAREKAGQLLKEFDVKAPGLDARACQLSGGNLQKMVLAREFFRRPRLIVAEQPTQGLDIAAAEEVRNLLLKAREQAGILIVTGDLAEALTLSDRIAVMYEGAILDCFSRDDEKKVTALPQMIAGLHC